MSESKNVHVFPMARQDNKIGTMCRMYLQYFDEVGQFKANKYLHAEVPEQLRPQILRLTGAIIRRRKRKADDDTGTK